MSRRNSTQTENINFVERLIEVCSTSKPAKISRLLDVSYQAARNYLQGRLPEANVLLIISERTPYSIHWLITGEGKKFVEINEEKGNEIFTDEMRAFVRRECLDLINEVLSKPIEPVSQKIVVLSSEKIRQEKVIDDSVTLLINNRG